MTFPRCGSSVCPNPLCFSSPKSRTHKPEFAALMSMELASRADPHLLCPGCKNKSASFKGLDSEPRKSFLHAFLCTSPFKSLFRETLPLGEDDLDSDWVGKQRRSRPSSLQFDLSMKDSRFLRRAMSSCVDVAEGKDFSLPYLTLPIVESVIVRYNETGNFDFVSNMLKSGFMSSKKLNTSFRSVCNSVRLSEEEDDDDDRTVGEEKRGGLDYESVSQAYSLILKIEPKELVAMALTNAIEILLTALESQTVKPDEIYQLLIIMENPFLADISYHEILKKLCKIVCSFQTSTRHAFMREISSYDTDRFLRLVGIFEDHLGSLVYPKQRSESHLIHPVEVLAILYNANEEAFHRRRECVVPFTAFYNEALSKKLDIKYEYKAWDSYKKEVKKKRKSFGDFHLFDYPFLFNPTSKIKILHIDAVTQMKGEYEDALVQQAALYQAQSILDSSGQSGIRDVQAVTSPFLVLDIRRDHIVEDSLARLADRERDLKKPLKIRYVGGGEQGFDMGGVQKEFFHVLVDSIFDPSYGMFNYVEQSRCFWFNSASLETEKEFELVGILLGLAIYNGVILDVHFPSAVYKKLQGVPLTLDDLVDVQPSLGRSLQQLLDFDGDVENVFCFTFQISYMVYGQVVDVDLIPNGSTTAVTMTNRKEFVDLYVQHLLVDSIAPQYEAFNRGIKKVCGTDALGLCRPEELELLICGSPHLDFDLLEKSTLYEGYKRDSDVIQWFWEIVHDMTKEQKKQLLMFVTGSDRVPLKGMGSLSFAIQRHSDDLDRLPSAMTCFSRLFLPPYESKRMLHERLTKAIENAKGFGLV
ncbi:probable E3 ubiquitin-protein ligase HECTD2 isoform X2 [Oscarella lobularis]|uniref:probable E3 ubiquitin-protein ligase HECTD2 isoform X2 n=1 Tax=Oscarella lobularis TaxID=121494 RepID=UPI003313BB83